MSVRYVSQWRLIIFFILMIVLCHEFKWLRGQGNSRKILMIPLSTRLDHMDRLRQSSQASSSSPSLASHFPGDHFQHHEQNTSEFSAHLSENCCWQKCCGWLSWIMESTFMQELKLHRSIWWNWVACTWGNYRNTNWCNTQQLIFVQRPWFR